MIYKYLPIFNRCHVRDLAKLVPTLSIEKMKQDEIIYDFGEHAHSIYLIKSGKVIISKYDKEIESGQFVGLEAACRREKTILQIVSQLKKQSFIKLKKNH